MREWVFRLAGRLNWAPHTLQRYGLSPARPKITVMSFFLFLIFKTKTKNSFYCLTWASSLGSSNVAGVTVGHIVVLSLYCRLVVMSGLWISRVKFWDSGAGWNWGSKINHKHTACIDCDCTVRMCMFEMLKYLRYNLWNETQSLDSYLFPPCERETMFGDPQRAVARGEGLGQNPRSRRPAPVWWREVHSLENANSIQFMKSSNLIFNVILPIFTSLLPINLTRHFSRPRLCWCCGCHGHPVCDWWWVTLRFFCLLFLHRCRSTERVKDNVLVFFPIAGLWVWCGFGITLKK